MALRGFYTTYQSNSSLCNKYYETMNNLRCVISHFGGVIGNHPFLIDKSLKSDKPEDPDDPTDNNKAAANTATEEAYMVTAFLLGLNYGRYGVLLNELHNAFRMRCDKYPNTLMVAYDLSINWKGDKKLPSMAPNEGVSFTTESEEVDVHTTNGMKIIRSGKPVVCHVCSKNHYSNKLPYR